MLRKSFESSSAQYEGRLKQKERSTAGAGSYRGESSGVKFSSKAVADVVSSEAGTCGV